MGALHDSMARSLVRTGIQHKVRDEELGGPGCSTCGSFLFVGVALLALSSGGCSDVTKSMRPDGWDEAEVGGDSGGHEDGQGEGGGDLGYMDQSDVSGSDVTQSGMLAKGIVVVTFNTGTGGMYQSEGNDGYGKQQAEWCDEYYGNGLAWVPFVEKTRQWFDEVRPDIVVFQEIFWPGDCLAIPQEAAVGFVCETWSEGDPVVAQMLLGADYQVMCNPGSPDKCAAVRNGLGSFELCQEPLCLEGMSGFKVDGCGKSARIGRGVIRLVDGSRLTLVNVHGSSGLTEDDNECRKRQFRQIFEDLGDGEPAANGDLNLIMGDFNTDPVRLEASDVSAEYIMSKVGEGKTFSFITDVGFDAQATYALLNIDHVISDHLAGDCWHAGVSSNRNKVMDQTFFDHTPAVCQVAYKGSTTR